MNDRRPSEDARRIRGEILVALRIVYPGALKGDHLLRGLIALFPQLEFDDLKRDLHYLLSKGYLERVNALAEPPSNGTPWRARWFRLSPRGVDVADRCTDDPAIQP